MKSRRLGGSYLGGGLIEFVDDVEDCVEVDMRSTGCTDQQRHGR